MGFLSSLMEMFKAEEIDFKQLINGGAKVIDVRSPAEYAGGHIEGSVNIPHSAIGAGIGAVAPDTDAPVIIYCHSGGRAAFARGVLEKAGYTNVINGRTYGYMSRMLSE